MLNILRNIMLLTYAAGIVAFTACNKEKVENATTADSYPDIFPDYVGVTVPVNIAPLNFCVNDDNVRLVDVVLSGNNGEELHVQGSEADFPIDDWHKLLQDNANDSITVRVSVKGDKGWTSYRSFGIHVSADSIDYAIAYRLVSPGYEKYSKMGIYQRCLNNFDEAPVFENTQVRGCINCHSFRQTDPQYLNMHVRGEHGGTVLRTPAQQMQVYNTKTDSTISACVYPYWHPSGRFIAYSTNETRQMVHTDPNKVLEVFDLASDVQVYDTEGHKLLIPDVLTRDSIWETFPSFSPDGKSLYFSAAAAVPMPDGVKAVRYDICRVTFDPTSGSFGSKVDTLVHASALGKSALMARPSYDGKYIVYTLADYGTFPIWHNEADLWILDLNTGESRPMTELNSSATESYHSWSTNSRWLVFASRRGDGRHTCPYIAHVDASGRVSRPFLLPQRSPRAYYDDQYRSFNIPEFVSSPINLDRSELESQLSSDTRQPFSPAKK